MVGRAGAAPRRQVGHAAQIRSTARRKADVLKRLSTDRDAWIATATSDGIPHLVPVSLCWHQQQILLATRGDRPLGQNITATRRARIGLGDGHDVVLIDAIAAITPWSEADPAFTQAFGVRAGWDPGAQPGQWLLLRLNPQQIRAWRTVQENHRGSVLMRDGHWAS